MPENDDRIKQLLDKLDELLKKQEAFSREVDAISKEVQYLRYGQPEAQQGPTPEPVKPAEPAVPKPPPLPKQVGEQPAPPKPETHLPPPPPVRPPRSRSNIEKFIGENLIATIGIAILVIGVAIGAKYAIDHDLISPLTRIVLGYAAGLALFGFAVRLKAKYPNFSAVLLSGAMAILYFITFAAHGFYDLIPQPLTFGLMAFFTVFTALAALNYNKQVIVLIGLVGAYGVPFLLSDGSGNYAFLFAYMAIVNAGILVIAFRKNWKVAFYAAFGLTWLIFLSWFNLEYDAAKHFTLAMTFAAVFFIEFYLTFLGYKLLQKEQFNFGDIASLLLNSFVFYGMGYAILSGQKQGAELLGLFTLANAIVHFIVSAVIYRGKLADRNLFYLVSGLVLVFLTLTFPVQLDGNWVTLIWAAEAALLFWIGRSRNVPVYEKMSYPLMFLAFFSLVQDWMTFYPQFQYQTEEVVMKSVRPFWNVQFLTGILVAVSFFFIRWEDSKMRGSEDTRMAFSNPQILKSSMRIALATMLLLTLYFTGQVEINAWFDGLYWGSAVMSPPDAYDYSYPVYNNDFLQYKVIWMLNYTMGFLTILSFLNLGWLRSRILAAVNLVVSALTILSFLVGGLYALSLLRESYLTPSQSEYFSAGSWNLYIRYVSLAFLAGLLFATGRYIRNRTLINANLKVPFEIVLHLTLLWVASSEWIHWMDIADPGQSYKLGLSILWGIYSLLLIVLGIWRRKGYLRITAIALFGITLLKLFLYDIAHLSTIGKTIIFVSLGVLLLVISFLYNKYKNTIFDEA
ncbi:MAG TPA: DUF2339 domain-containing protein [Flavilitoribacter sp.]|nr:DUF2339 domain-containing protein [Flavilitoribacter sp.]